jgi:hypothetical protein
MQLYADIGMDESSLNEPFEPCKKPFPSAGRAAIR